MKVFLASDHAGYELKEVLNTFLTEHKIPAEDLGPHAFNPNDDYTEYMFALASAVVGEKGSFGIGIGGSGQGEAMAVNRVKGARASVFYGGNIDVLKVSRKDNGANVLCLGARFLSQDEAKRAVEYWLKTPFSNEERHMRRIQKLDT
jgi:ribose 5-phosphate isomerase B